MRNRSRSRHEPAWAIGTIGVSFDEAEDRVVLVIEELVGEDEAGPSPG